METQPILPSFFELGGAAAARTQLAWLGMAGVLVNARGALLLVDPLIAYDTVDGPPVSEVGYRLKLPFPIQAKDVPQADLVMYTHADDDHFAPLTAKTLAGHTHCRFLAPPPVVERLAELGIARERILLAQEACSLQVGAVEVVVTPALHDWQEQNPWKREDCCGYLLKTPDGTLWHPGDTRLIDDLLAIRGVDVLFFDVAAVEAHLGPQGSARLAKTCGAKVLIAYHYGTFDMPPGSFGNCDPLDALPYIQGLPARFLRLEPGEVFHFPVQD